MSAALGGNPARRSAISWVVYLDFGEDFSGGVLGTDFIDPVLGERARRRHERNAALLRQRGIEPGPLLFDGAAFGDLEIDFRLAIPILGLALPWTQVPDASFRPGRRWVAAQHQAGGLTCAQTKFVFSPLTIRPRFRAPAEELCAVWFDTGAEPWHRRLGAGWVNDYRAQLRSGLGVDATRSWDLFQEAVYPIDCTLANVRHLAGDDDIPDDLNDLLADDDRQPVTADWRLLLLGPNSD